MPIPDKQLEIKPVTIGAFLDMCERLDQDPGDVLTVVAMLEDWTNYTHDEIRGLLVSELGEVFAQFNAELEKAKAAAIPPPTATASESTEPE